MQQIELSAGKDTESVYQLIGSLMQNNREFQVVITVPSRRGEYSGFTENQCCCSTGREEL